MCKSTYFLLAVSLLTLIAVPAAKSQGTFVNLDFEAANVQDLPVGSGEFVSVSNGVPGWTVYLNGAQQSSMPHNAPPLSGAAVVIFGPHWPGPILQGSYSLGIGSSSAGPAVVAAAGQVGQIPADAKSLTLYLAPVSGIQVTFAGQPIPITQVGAGPNYNIFGGDVAAFAGQTGELRFTAPLGNSALLDDIVFSTQSIPESGVFGLCALGLLLLGWRFRRS
jgi:hypothetical protein